MRRASISLALLVALVLPVIAGEIKTETIKVPTIQCGMCKSKIEGKVKKMKGLKSVTVDVENKTATVKYDTDKVSLSKIEEAISSAGYDANDVKAEEKAQKALHACCRPGAHE